MKISNFEQTGLDKIEDWLKSNPKRLGKEEVKEVLKSSNISFVFEGINRLQSMLLCELKLSYVQQSQRYVKTGGENYVVPEMENAYKKQAINLINRCYELYSRMSELKEEAKGKTKRPKQEDYKYGIPIEDARYILPIAAKTNISVAMTGDKLVDLYELFNNTDDYMDIFFEVRYQFNKYIPDNIRKYVDNPGRSIRQAADSFYSSYFEKIGSNNNMINIDSFKNLDVKAGIGALTSTSLNTPSEVMESYGSDVAAKAKDVTKRVLSYGHTSIIEQARTTFGMMCSMVTYHQQIRHRLSSNYRESLNNLIDDLERPAVIPPTIESSTFKEEYLSLINEIKRFRTDYIKHNSCYPEVYPLIINGEQIKLIISTNARIDCEMMQERICMNAQWEIRNLYIKKLLELRKLSGIIYEGALPSCFNGKCKEGAKTCGKQDLLKEIFKK